MTGTGIAEKTASTASLERRGALPSMLAQLATILLVSLLVRALVEGIFTQNVNDWPYNPAVIRMAGTIAVRFLEVLAVFLALSILFRVTRYGSFADLGLARRGLRWLPVGFTVPTAALLLACLLAYGVGLLPSLRLLNPGLWPTLFALAASTHAAFVEELGFRGVLMQGIERLVGGGYRGRNIAIVTSGLLFAALHLLAPFDLTWAWWIVVTAGGLGFGWAFYAAGRNLWLPIGLHLGFDLGLFLLLGLPGETQGWLLSPVLRPAPALSQVGGYIMLIATLLTLLALLLLLNRGRGHKTAFGDGVPEDGVLGDGVSGDGVMDEKRVRVIVHGYVQGVGFRAACQAEAVTAGVRGWVKNKWDGSVEALFEGPAAAVDHMLLWCERGPRAADVDFVEQHAAPEPAPPGPFRIR